MTLTLSITNHDRLDNGMPTEFVLHRRGALIGRSPTCDWSLPDARNFISSRHAEVSFVDGFYTLNDISMNGTLLNGASDRMSAPRRIEHGDVFTIGQYEVRAALTGEAAAAVEHQQDAIATAEREGQWRGWGAHAEPAPPPADTGGWGSPPAGAGWGSAPTPASDAGWSAGDGGWGPAPAPATPSGGGWQPQTGPSLARSDAPSGTPGAATPAPLTGGEGWSLSARAPDIEVRSAWAQHVEKPDPASGWSSAAPDRPPAPSPDDIWGKMADGNVVDWARGGFGQPQEQRRDPLGLERADPQASLGGSAPRAAGQGGWSSGAMTTSPAAEPPMPPTAGWGGEPSAPQAGWGAPPAAPSPVQGGWGAPPPEAAQPPRMMPAASVTPPPSPPPPARATSAGADPTALAQVFVAALGTAPGAIKDLSPTTMERAGQLFRRLVAGLVVMVEARARAKSQMGAEATAFEFEGNNPIKFARSPEEAIATLLAPQQRGFMTADRAVEDAFFDLQSHQMATLKAMQGALRATLDRFSPAAIRQRAEGAGVMARILPGAREAALWQAYEKEFGGVAQGSDEAFMDVFAKEFRRAYEEQAAHQRARRRG